MLQLHLYAIAPMRDECLVAKAGRKLDGSGQSPLPALGTVGNH